MVGQYLLAAYCGFPSDVDFAVREAGVQRRDVDLGRPGKGDRLGEGARGAEAALGVPRECSCFWLEGRARASRAARHQGWASAGLWKGPGRARPCHLGDGVGRAGWAAPETKPRVQEGAMGAMWEAVLASCGGFALRSGPHSGARGAREGQQRTAPSGLRPGIRRTGWFRGGKTSQEAGARLHGQAVGTRPGQSPRDREKASPLSASPPSFCSSVGRSASELSAGGQGRLPTTPPASRLRSAHCRVWVSRSQCRASRCPEGAGGGPGLPITPSGELGVPVGRSPSPPVPLASARSEGHCKEVSRLASSPSSASCRGLALVSYPRSRGAALVLRVPRPAGLGVEPGVPARAQALGEGRACRGGSAEEAAPDWPVPSGQQVLIPRRGLQVISVLQEPLEKGGR